MKKSHFEKKEKIKTVIPLLTYSFKYILKIILIPVLSCIKYNCKGFIHSCHLSKLEIRVYFWWLNFDFFVALIMLTSKVYQERLLLCKENT